MRMQRLSDGLLPLFVLAFVGGAVTFLQPIFNATTRWGVLGFVAVYLLFSGRLVRPLRNYFGLLTLIFALWALTTGIWSEVPQLSYLKAFAFILIAFTGMAIGQVWVHQHSPQDSLKYLFPLTVVTLLAGMLGQVIGQGVDDSGGTTMYYGLVRGSNMFGSMLAMCSPFLAWQIYRFWGHRRKRALWLLLGGMGLYYLFASISRAAILIVLCTALGLFLSLGLRRKLRIFVLLLGATIGALVLAPSQFEELKNRLVYKDVTTEKGVFYTREEIWRESYELAEKGGWTGGGYGVTIGEKNFQGTLTAVGYGREKGNSQFAIVEETGLVGLLIYLISLVALFTHLGRVVLRLPRGPDKVLLSIVTGTLLGMIIQSVFEAWWVAPSSQESAYFWTLAGVALALTERVRQRAVRRVGSPAFMTTGLNVPVRPPLA